jgi:hypothetical protein
VFYCVCVLFVLLTLSILSLCCGSKMHKISLSLFSLCSLERSPQIRTTRTTATVNAPLRAALLFSSSLFLFFRLYILVMNTKIILMERLFPSVTPFNTHRSTNKEESLLFSVQQTKELTLRSTETAPFCTKKSKAGVPSYRLTP